MSGREDRSFAGLFTIGQTPVRKSDKKRLGYRTDSDNEGRRAVLPFHDARECGEGIYE